MSQEVSTKPYLIRAIYEWCADQGYTPYIAVAVDGRTQVPREYVKNGEIVLNVSAVATHLLNIGNEWIDFQARFNGRPRDISVPVDNVTAIYARETGHGMAFDVPKAMAVVDENEVPDAPFADDPDAAPLPKDRGARPPAKGLRSVGPAVAASPQAAPAPARDRSDDHAPSGEDIPEPPNGGPNSTPPTGGKPTSKNHLTRVK